MITEVILKKTVPTFNQFNGWRRNRIIVQYNNLSINILQYTGLQIASRIFDRHQRMKEHFRKKYQIIQNQSILYILCTCDWNEMISPSILIYACWLLSYRLQDHHIETAFDASRWFNRQVPSKNSGSSSELLAWKTSDKN